MDPFGDEDDPWPDEPEEFDPDSLGPEAPDVEPDLEESFRALDDVDDDLFRTFWGAAVFLNVAVAALAIGAMLVYFRGDWTRGGPALVIGAVAAGFTLRFYLGFRRDREGSDAGDQGVDR